VLDPHRQKTEEHEENEGGGENGPNDCPEHPPSASFSLPPDQSFSLHQHRCFSGQLWLGCGIGRAAKCPLGGPFSLVWKPALVSALHLVESEPLVCHGVSGLWGLWQFEFCGEDSDHHGGCGADIEGDWARIAHSYEDPGDRDSDDRACGH